MITSINERLALLKSEHPEAYYDLVGHMREGKGKRGEVLVKINSVCKNMYIVTSGLARHYRYDEEGKEFNCWFSFEGDIVLPLASFLYKIPSKEGVELIEPCTYQYISYEHLFLMTQKHHALETLFRQMLEVYYIEMEDRLYRIQAYSAEKKYNYLLQEQPRILERISQVHVASYLGISRETLSRIRAKHRITNN